ncbi:adenine nucleotide alpha hydrolase [Geotalea uraniireducens]|uniref:Adenine nucleotide alpha hydrolase n=1 Tax=Geotalea uraniireducens TaxID=351604 RepID=A0ABM8EGX6_9BACT|nr:ATP-dependent sacrificial sulfur transferase LarE [Geotalea uraniireducens]BDV41684.1 adenine nucleotide alpha hydrolase [Geotalea uraniireducens]
MSELTEKFATLQRIIREMGSMLIGFSGGVDSTLLLRVAYNLLGDRVVALTATSPTYPESEFQAAEALAREIGVRQLVVESNELAIPGFAANPRDRCYHCKKELLQLCRDRAAALGLAWVADGSNLDDLGDFRPGREAVRELGVRSPLLEAGLTKAEIRELSRRLGLPTWDKQPFACLASRFPYGTEITLARLRQVGACEEYLRELGFAVYRVRYHGETARIELGEEELERLLAPGVRREVVSFFKKAGFTYVALDLEGYRSGSMNEPLTGE